MLAARRHSAARLKWLPQISGALLFVSLVVATAHIALRPASDATSVTGADLLVTVRAGGYGRNYCQGSNPTNFLGSSNRWWLFLLIPGVIFLFVGLAIVTDKYFVPSLECICEHLKLSEDVAGATFMAAGSSAPELFTSLLAALWTKDDVGIGTIVGSAVFNILVIIGLSAALAREPLDLDWRPMIRDSTFYVASIALLIVFVMWVGGYQGTVPGHVQWWEGLILVTAYVGYVLFLAYGNKAYFKWAERFQKAEPAPKSTSEADNDGGEAQQAESVPQPPETPTQTLLERNGSRYYEKNVRSHVRVVAMAVLAANGLMHDVEDRENEVSQEDDTWFLGVKKPKGFFAKASFPFLLPWNILYHLTILDCSKEHLAKYWYVTFGTSIVWIMIISFLMVEATRLAGCFMGIDSAVMGLTFLAAGTSVPDALASVSVARNGFGNMAVSNAIGSNVFDILLGLGLPWFLAGLINTPKTNVVTVKPITVIVVPIGILFGVIVLLVGILMLLKWKLSKTLGIILFVLYATFILWSLFDPTK